MEPENRQRKMKSKTEKKQTQGASKDGRALRETLQGRCLEYDIGIPPDCLPAAKYSRLLAILNDPMRKQFLNLSGARPCCSFESGARSSLLSAISFRRPCGWCKDFCFCLEHGRGAKQNIEAAVECLSHPEGDINYRRCLRVLDRSEVPDRSSRISAFPG
jgi:hypothetical protein